MWKTASKNKLYISYLKSYLIMGAILFIFTVIFYQNCETNLERELKTSQNTVLTLLQETFDHNIEAVKKAGQILAGDEEVQKMGEKREFAREDHFTLEKLSSELVLWQDKLGICSDISIYFSQSDCFVSQDGIYPEQLKELYFEKKNLTQKALEQIMNGAGLTGCEVCFNREKEPFLYIYENVYAFNLKEKRAIIVMEVPWEQIQKLCTIVSDADVYWQNSGGTTLFVKQSAKSDSVPVFDASVKEGELFTSGKGNQKQVSSFRNAREYDWKYVISMNEKEYFAEVNKMKTFAVILLATMLGMVIILALYYSHTRYVPIQRILEAVRKNQKGGEIQEIGEVEKYLENLCSENKRLEHDINRFQETTAGEILAGYIKGWNTDMAMVREILLQRNLFLQNGYLVFLITLRDIDSCKLLENEDNAKGTEDSSLLEFVFQNIFNEIVQSICGGILIRVEKDFLYLTSVEKGKENICDALEKCARAYGDYLNLSIFIGGSKYHEGEEELQRAYNEALQVLMYQTFWGNGTEKILLYESEYEEGEVWLEEGITAQEQRQIYQLLKNGQYEDVEKLLDDILDKMFVKDIRYTRMNRYKMNGLINMLCMMLDELLSRKDKELLKEIKPMETMMQTENIEEARSILLSVMKEVMQSLQKEGEEIPHWVKEVKQDIETNYQDINLSLSGLAEKQNMNLAYMGRTFKQYTGVSIPDYIHTVRIRECKLLLAKNVSVKDAAEQVGYIDAKTLIRIFKKQEGITPGQYKSYIEELGIDHKI